MSGRKGGLIILIAALACLLGSCKGMEGTAEPVDQDMVDKLGTEYCPKGHQLKVFWQKLKLFEEPFPNPAVFGIQHGRFRCALSKPLDEGAEDKPQERLIVGFSRDCLKNGSLWLLERQGLAEDDMAFFHFKSADPDSDDWLNVDVKKGRSLDDLRAKIGLIVYECRPATP